MQRRRHRHRFARRLRLGVRRDLPRRPEALGKKPTIAFVMSGALSGGYLIACAARKIVALPTALVGSIGVIFTRPVVQELMEKVGVKMVMTHEGKLKGMFQPWREPTPEEQAKVQALTEEYYELVRGCGGEVARDLPRRDGPPVRHGRDVLRGPGQGDRPRRRAGRLRTWRWTWPAS